MSKENIFTGFGDATHFLERVPHWQSNWGVFDIKKPTLNQHNQSRQYLSETISRVKAVTAGSCPQERKLQTMNAIREFAAE